jgi:hypothetical protein
MFGGVYCKDGWELAMRFGTSSQFTFHSPYWTNADLLNPETASDPTSDSDGKFAAFTDTVATEIKGCLPDGCKEYTLPSAQTLQALFTDTPISSTTNIQFDETPVQKKEWCAIAGHPGCVATAGGTNRFLGTGINYDDDLSFYDSRVRFGLLINNQANVYTNNDAVGFGASAYGGHDDGLDQDSEDRVGAGYPRGAGAAGGRNLEKLQGTIWIKSV